MLELSSFNPWFNGLSFINNAFMVQERAVTRRFNPWFNGLSFINLRLEYHIQIFIIVSILGLMDYLLSIKGQVKYSRHYTKFQSLV